MPTNQHGPYFQRETSGVVDSPNKKFDNIQNLDRPGVTNLHRPGMQYHLQKQRYQWTRTGNTPQSFKVSIIMPTFRRQHTIKHAVGSILNQTYTNWQLIIIDNESRNPLYDFKDARIECHNHDDTPSAGFARNKGVEYIKGDLVCFFDDDDQMNPLYLEKMVAPFQDPKIIMSHCKVRFEDDPKIDGAYCTPSAMVRANSITPTWNCEYSGHDQAYWGSIMSCNDRYVCQIDEVLVYCSTSPKGGLREGHL